MGAIESTQTFKTLRAAAQAYGEAHGVYGKAGGWLWQEGIRLNIHGWEEFGLHLVRTARIDPQDENGVSVRRLTDPGRSPFGPGGYTTASERQWRRNARQFALIKRED
jgi:hypothetical protein